MLVSLLSTTVVVFKGGASTPLVTQTFSMSLYILPLMHLFVSSTTLSVEYGLSDIILYHLFFY